MATLDLTLRFITLLPSVEMDVSDFSFKPHKVKFDKWCDSSSNLSVHSSKMQVSIPICLWLGSLNVLRASIMKLVHSLYNPTILHLKYKCNRVQIVVLWFLAVESGNQHFNDYGCPVSVHKNLNSINWI